MNYNNMREYYRETLVEIKS